MTHRSIILDNAGKLISGDRAATYGDARTNFARLGRLWAATLGLPEDIHPELVAIMLTHLKLARLAGNPDHEDSWTDAAGYIALGAEIATTPTEIPY